MLGNDFDMIAVTENINLQEKFNITFPTELRGSIGYQRCSSIIKRTAPVYWPSKHGITTYRAKDLIFCGKWLLLKYDEMRWAVGQGEEHSSSRIDFNLFYTKGKCEFLIIIEFINLIFPYSMLYIWILQK